MIPIAIFEGKKARDYARRRMNGEPGDSHRLSDSDDESKQERGGE
jgi:hypothetical protein